MGRRTLEVRDAEVLRTIGRLRYVTMPELVGRFFPSDDVARRRLRYLRDRGLIRTHVKGVPSKLRYEAWRLTARGIDDLLASSPEEPLPDGLADRLAEGSLVNIDHREALNRVYLEIIAHHVPPSAAERAEVVAHARRIRACAEQIWWQADGDVTLRLQVIGRDPHRPGRLVRDEQIIPDATLCSRVGNQRIFLEVDRSSRTLTRIATTIERYRHYLQDYYSRHYQDGRTPVVLFVVRSAGRRAGIDRQLKKTLGTGSHQALEHAAAVTWLREQLVSAPADASAAKDDNGEDTIATMRALYLSLHAFRAQLKQTGQDLPADTKDLLWRVRRQIKAAS